MKVQQRVEKVTKELVSKEGFRNLKVKTICENAAISRKTFYTFYKDKVDVIESIFYNDIFSYVLDLYELFGDVKEISPLILEKVYQRYLNEKSFYTQLFEVDGDRKLEDCITYHLQVFNQNYLQKINISVYEAEYLSYYFSASQVFILKKWIQDDMILTPKEIAEIHQRLINNSFLKSYYPEKLRFCAKGIAKEQ